MKICISCEKDIDAKECHCGEEPQKRLQELIASRSSSVAEPTHGKRETRVRSSASAPELDDICRNNHGGNPRSEEANRKIASGKAETQQKVLDYAYDQGYTGIIADEVAAAWKCSHNHVAPRMSELKAMDKLVPNGQKRLTRATGWADVLVHFAFAPEKKLELTNVPV